jgi:hypothetical protein
MWIWYICCCDLADVSTCECECDISVGECESIFDLENDITAGLNRWWWVTNHSRLRKEPADMSFITAGHQKNRLWYVPHYRWSATLAGCDMSHSTAGYCEESTVKVGSSPPVGYKTGSEDPPHHQRTFRNTRKNGCDAGLEPAMIASSVVVQLAFCSSYAYRRDHRTLEFSELAPIQSNTTREEKESLCPSK